MNIYVGNLAFDVTEDEIKVMFDEFGKVESVKLIKDRFSGRSKGFGFVDMPDNSEADQAIKVLNGNLIKGRHIKINHADSGGKRGKKKKRKMRRY
jgi:RNA recognition motif-containing protein